MSRYDGICKIFAAPPKAAINAMNMAAYQAVRASGERRVVALVQFASPAGSSPLTFMTGLSARCSSSSFRSNWRCCL
jgi:hypothetical protein